MLLTPGHSPGHCCFYEPNLGVLYGGDVSLITFGPWYGTPGSEIGAFKSSLQRLLKLDLRVVATSARGPIREGIKERLQAFYDRIDQRDEKISAYLREPRTMVELVDRLLIYDSLGERAAFHPIIRCYDRMMLEKHLTGLLAAGRVQCTDGLYRACD